MKNITIILTAALGCALFPLDSNAAQELCVAAGDLAACSTFASPPSYPPLFQEDVCVDSSDNITLLSGSYCARGSTHYECLVGEVGSTGVVCYALPASELVTRAPFDYISPTYGCLLHEVDGEGECATPRAQPACCDTTTIDESADCVDLASGQSCSGARPYEMDVCTAPDESTAGIPGGNQPNEFGDCDAGLTPIYDLSGTFVVACIVALAGGGDGDGDGDGGGGCPG